MYFIKYRNFYLFVVVVVCLGFICLMLVCWLWSEVFSVIFVFIGFNIFVVVLFLVCDDILFWLLVICLFFIFVMIFFKDLIVFFNFCIFKFDFFIFLLKFFWFVLIVFFKEVIFVFCFWILIKSFWKVELSILLFFKLKLFNLFVNRI